MKFWALAAMVSTGALFAILLGSEKPSHAQDVCRLNEARQIACAAASKSWEIDHNWPRAQGVFAVNMSHLDCGESRKWDSVCR